MPSRRTVIPHVDDLGSSHGANQAYIELAAAGLVTCGSVMVPGPWFRELVDAAGPSLDIGVHLTLTSEWDACRWAPISTVSRASGLLDDDGYLWRDVESLRRHLVPEAAEAEMRAQIERAIAAGLQPTHIDAHMAAAMLPELLDAHVRLGVEYRLMPVLPRSIGWAPDPGAYRDTVDRLARDGAPVVEHCRGTQPVAAADLHQAWQRTFDDLPSGLTHLALHCTKPSDFSAMSPDHAGWRYAEYDFIAAGRLAKLFDDAGMEVCGMRTLHAAWSAWASVTRSEFPHRPGPAR